MASNRPSQIPSVKKSSFNQMLENRNSNSNNHFFGPTNIPSTVKSSNRSTLITNSLGFNSVGKSQISGSSGFSSTIKMSSNKNFLHNSNIPSTVKSASRAHHQFSNFGFNSVQKNTAKLFGMTPKTNRSSFMQNAASTTRLSSRSNISSRYSSAKDNRPLSDSTYQRECQEKIVDFLNTNGYPQQLTRQNLIRLSLSEASRIFQFLFSFFTENVVIKNGPDTSLNAVVPKMMPLFGYPYPIKNSDLVSFSGGRQLGSVLSMIDFLIDKINYSLNLDVSRVIGRDFVTWSEDDESDNVDVNKVLPKLHDLACSLNWENDSLEDEKVKHFNNLSEEFYGNEHEVEQFRKEVENLEQTLSKLDEELVYLTELPNRKQELTNDIENCSKYIQEMIEHNKANLIIKNALIDEIYSNKESLKNLLNESKRLENSVDAQKDVVIEYQYAIERRKQIQDEIKQAESQIKNTKEMISSLTLEINKEKSQLESLVNDLDEMINIIFTMCKNSKIHRFLPDLIVVLEKDKEWENFFKNFEKIKSLSHQSVDSINETTYGELKETTMKKFKHFKMHLVDQATKLKTTISLEVVCHNQKRQKQRNQTKQEASDLDEQLQTLWREKNQNEAEHQIEMEQLNGQIERFKQKILDHEKLLNNGELSLKRLEDQIKVKENEIIMKKYDIMKNFKEKVIKQKQYEDKLMALIDKYENFLKRQNRKLEKTMEELLKI